MLDTVTDLFEEAAISKTSARDANEDVYRSCAREGSSCWIVADGLGGHRWGDVASKLVAEGICRSFSEDPSISPEAVERHLSSAHDELRARQAAQIEYSNMRTTAVVLVSDGASAVWGHVGDSRLYHFRNGILIDQTKDHSVSQFKVDGGEIEPDQLRGDVDRNSLIQTIGKKDAIQPAVVEEHVSLCQSDVFLLCTDGFWELVLEDEMEIDYAKSSTCSEWLELMQARIFHRQPAGGDNYTAIAVRAADPTLPPPPLHVRRTKPVPRPGNRRAIRLRAEPFRAAAATVVTLCLLALVVWCMGYWAGFDDAASVPPSNPPAATKVPNTAYVLLDATRALQRRGYPLPMRGVWNDELQAALRSFQEAEGLKVTGELDRETLERLDVSLERRRPGAAGRTR